MKSFRDWDAGSKLLVAILASWLFPTLLSALVAVAGLGEIDYKVKTLVYFFVYGGFLIAIVGLILGVAKEAARDTADRLTDEFENRPSPMEYGPGHPGYERLP
jgi:MFS-type transporter involved in bile tolerance (Atg22 family)